MTAVAVPTERIVRDRLLIGGEWVRSGSSAVIEVTDAATGSVIGTVPAGVALDVDRAVAAARLAFPGWRATPLPDRLRLLRAVADGITARGAELAALIVRELGMPTTFATMVQTGLPAITFASMADLAPAVLADERIGNSLVVRDPAGVVGCITPWNYPLHQVAAKVAPALAAGCTVVLKPSEVTPLCVFVLGEIIVAAGIPAGVVNIVSGEGPVVGEALAAHPGVDMVSFTGSTRAGRRVAEVAAATVKRVALELGGKSANILLDDVADLETIVTDAVARCMLNSGQTCSALTRLLVPRPLLPTVEAIAAAVAEVGFAPGDPTDPAVRLGPLVSAVQLERVRAIVDRGLAEGARLVCGGTEPPPGREQGYWFRPTVLSDVTPTMAVAREEIFGPVLVLIPYDSEKEAIEIADSTIYGLAGGVWSADIARAERVARQLHTGQVDVNGGTFNPLAPFGGHRQSGIGRELGPHGIAEFTELKAIQLP